ncbi:MAG: hypothetical protein ACK5MU_03575 [Candidatus Saccharimonadales bacterium]
MTKISDTLMPLYNKLLPKCEEQKISLNLDLPDPTIPVEDAKALEKLTKKLIKDAAARIGKKGTITVGVKKGVKYPVIITIKDSGTALTREERETLEADENVTVRSRMGYGTTITVKISA